MSNSTLDWLKAAFSVQSIRKDEVMFPCPYCGGSSFYFNFKKKIGFCHKARCGKKPTLKDLTVLKGYGPSGGYSLVEPVPIVGKKDITMPGWQIEVEHDHWAIEALGHRGVTRAHISQWQIWATNARIYVPVVENGKIVQFVGRAINRNASPINGFETQTKPKYQYAEGESISHFIFGWDATMREWPYLVLVENTFNAIRWRDEFHCSTNFGSNLSDIQISTISRSNIKKVIFAWDGDAGQKAWVAANKLKSFGIPSTTIVYGDIDVNQPDELPEASLKYAINRAANTGSTTLSVAVFRKMERIYDLSSA